MLGFIMFATVTTGTAYGLTQIFDPSMAEFVLAGSLGGLCRTMLGARPLVLPKFWRKGESSGIDLGFISAVIIGAVIGRAVDHYFFTSLIAGYVGPDFLERASRKFLAYIDKDIPFVNHFIPNDQQERPQNQ